MASNLHLSIDLIEASKRQLFFLEEVDQNPQLYQGPCVTNAIRRYEQFWLPLAASSGNKQRHLAPPLDVHWVWHCHMLAPLAYAEDCVNLVKTVVDHALLSRTEYATAVATTKTLWERNVSGEPFDPDINQLTSTDYRSQCKYSLEAAIARQRLFYYQVSLPHYKDKHFLQRGLDRYRKYLFLKQKHPDEFLVPCYDIDLVWHSHQLHPLIYAADTTAILGHVLNHDDSVNDRSPGSKLNESHAKTRYLWSLAFPNEAHHQAGAMFRGTPPTGKLKRIPLSHIHSMASKSTQMELCDVTVENMVVVSEVFLSITVNSRSNVRRKLWKGKLSLQRAFKLEGSAFFKFDTPRDMGLQFEIVTKSLCDCLGQAITHKEAIYSLAQKLEEIPDEYTEESVSLALRGESRVVTSASAAKGVTVSFKMRIGKSTPGTYMLDLQPGPYNSVIMPPVLEHLWGPVHFTVAEKEGIGKSCIVGVHRYIVLAVRLCVQYLWPL